MALTRALVYVLPSLFVGTVLGNLSARAWSPVSNQPRSASPRAAAPVDAALIVSEESSDHRALDYHRLARACLEAAKSERNSDSRVAHSNSRLDEEKARTSLQQVEERALTSGVWSRVSGFKAQALLAAVSSEEAAAFSERISEQVRTGGLRLQSGAWVPASKAQ